MSPIMTGIREPERPDDAGRLKELKVRVPSDTVQQLRRLKLLSGVTASETVRRALELYLADASSPAFAERRGMASQGSQ